MKDLFSFRLIAAVFFLSQASCSTDRVDSRNPQDRNVQQNDTSALVSVKEDQSPGSTDSDTCSVVEPTCAQIAIEGEGFALDNGLFPICKNENGKPFYGNPHNEDAYDAATAKYCAWGPWQFCSPGFAGPKPDIVKCMDETGSVELEFPFTDTFCSDPPTCE